MSDQAADQPSSGAVLTRKGRTLAGQSLFTLAWLAPVWLMLGAARLAIVFVPFRDLAPRLGVLTGGAPWIPLVSPKQERRARQIGRTVRMAARYAPWRSDCFPQAVVGRALLTLYRIPYGLYFGLAVDTEGEDGLDAHAWLVSGRVTVTGGADSFSNFTVVGSFVAQPDE